MNESQLFTPFIQYGFAGMSMLLVGVIVWLIGRLLKLLDETNKIIAANTEAIHDVGETSRDSMRLTRQLHDKLISRPCIAERET